MPAEMSTDPVSELRDAVERAAASVRGGNAGAAEPSLERPPKTTATRGLDWLLSCSLMIQQTL